MSVHLVTHEGTRLQIPTSLERSADIFHALDRRFTQPLKRKALEAIVRGERLVFGAIGLDASGIDGGAWSLRWDQLSLVRVVNGQFAVFRGESILPSHTVRFDEVPHPWIFWALVTKLARATEVDDPRAFLGPPSHATLRPSGEK